MNQMRQSYGPDPRSFRAEGYGMASGLLFIHLLQQHFAITWSNERGNKLICDNEGLLIRIEKTLTWTYLQPNVTLRSEWDIESVILDAYKNIGWKFAFQHVRSHQDDSRPIHSLPLAVQLNIEADRLATEYLETSQYQGYDSIFPTAKCQLLLNGETISRKLQNAIRFQAGTGPIHAYMKDRNHWSQQTLNSIDWAAHGSAHSHYQNQRCFLVPSTTRQDPTSQGHQIPSNMSWLQELHRKPRPLYRLHGKITDTMAYEPAIDGTQATSNHKDG